MHQLAREWDKEHGIDSSFATGDKWSKGKVLPKDRPCDWCGKLVPYGFIHEICIKLERNTWSDILG